MRFFNFLALAGLLVACNAKADVEITNAWVRANAPGQSVGAAYMTLKSSQDSTFVFAETPAAGSVKIHSMSMDNGVMKMRMLEELPLKAGKAEKLAPGLRPQCPRHRRYQRRRTRHAEQPDPHAS